MSVVSENSDKKTDSKEYASELVEKSAKKSDKALMALVTAIFTAIVGAFACGLTLMIWFTEYVITEGKDSAGVLISLSAAWLIMAVVVGSLFASVVLITQSVKLRKLGRNALIVANQREAADLELAKKQAAHRLITEANAERERLVKLAQEASAAREAQARIAAQVQADMAYTAEREAADAAINAQAAAEKSKHVRLETRDGRNKSGGSSGRGKDV